MEAHSRSLPDEAALNLLLCLEQRDIVRAQLVCKQWHGVAQLARKKAFLRKWGFSDLLTEPRSPTLFESTPASSLVKRHVVSPGENVPQLALRFQVEPGELLRLNNLMNPHLLQHRHFVYIPVTRLHEVRGSCAAFEYSPLLCRDLLLVEPPPGCDPLRRQGGQQPAAAKPGAPVAAAAPRITFNRLLLREMQAHVRRLVEALPDGGGCGSGGGGGADAGGGGRQRPHPPRHLEPHAVVALDMSVAKFYLREAGGDTERAAHLFVDDCRWEQRQAARTAKHGDDGGSDVDAEYDVEYDAEYDGPQDEDDALVRRMAAWSPAQGRPQGPLGRARRLARRLAARLLSCGGGCCGGRPPRRGWQGRLRGRLLMFGIV